MFLGTSLVVRNNADELCSGIANDRVLNLELYTYRRQRLTLLHLFTDLFRKEICLTLQNKCKVSVEDIFCRAVS